MLLPLTAARFYFPLLITVVATFWCFLSQPVLAGAWVLPKGQAEIIHTVHYYHADTYVDVRGREQQQEDFEKLDYQLYSAFGLREDVSVGLNARIAGAMQDNALVAESDKANIALHDVELWGQWQFWQHGAWVSSAVVSGRLPRLWQKQSFPVMGRAHGDVAAAVNVGWSMPSQAGRNHFVDGALEYRHRLGDANDQLNFSATVGLSAGQRWQVLGQLFHTEPISSGTSTGQITDAGDYELTKAQLSMLYWWDEDKALQLGVFKDVQARNTGKGMGVVVGSWHRF